MTHERRDLVLGCGSEIEPAHDTLGVGDGLLTAAEHLGQQCSEEQPLGPIEALDLEEQWIVLIECLQTFHQPPTMNRSGIEPERIRMAGVERIGQFGHGLRQDSRCVEKPPGSGVAALEEAKKRIRRALVPAHGCRRHRGQPIEKALRRTGPCCLHGGLHRHLETAVIRWLGSQHDLPVTDGDPSDGRRKRNLLRRHRSGVATKPFETPPQKRRAHQCRRQHDEQQRCVEIVVEHAVWSPIVAKISPTSPRGSMPRPMSTLSPGLPIGAKSGETSLPTTATARRSAASRNTLGVANALTSVSMPIWRKNTGMNRCPTGANSRRMRSAAGCGSGQVRRRTRPTIGASWAESASWAKARVKASASATTVPVDREYRSTPTNSGGVSVSRPRSRRRGSPLRPRRSRHTQRRDGAVGHDPDDDGQDDEADDVVGDGGAEDDAGLGRGEGA